MEWGAHTDKTEGSLPNNTLAKARQERTKNGD